MIIFRYIYNKRGDIEFKIKFLRMLSKNRKERKMFMKSKKKLLL